MEMEMMPVLGNCLRGFEPDWVRWLKMADEP